MKEFKRYLVTAALPYANGPVHIGHLAGNFLPSDVYVRYLRANKKDVKFICGTDEHGVPITIRAMKEGVSPQEIVDKYHKIIDESLKNIGISFDIFSRTSKPIHHQTAQDFFTTLYKKGVFETKETEQYFDEEKQTFLADRYIMGTCPHCKNENAYGDQCEKCGTTLSPEELLNPRSTLSHSIPVKKKTTHWYLPLQNYESWLSQWILEEHSDWKNNVYGQCKSWLSSGLQARAMTRDSNWGVKVPLENAEGKVMYVWFDAPIGYISATKELTNNWADYWCKDDTKLIHFLGKDNIVFHCIIFPAMLKAHGDFVLPEAVPANEFLNIEGDKVSTSRNWAVWVDEYLADFPDMQDNMRYCLIANAPENKDNDFTWKDFQDRTNNELVAIYGNFVNRTLVLLHKFCDGKIPPFHLDAKTNEDDALYEKIVLAKQQIEEKIEAFKFREAIAILIDLSREGNKYLQEKEPWKHIDNKKLVDNCLHLCAQLCANLAILSQPFLPFTAIKLCRLLKVVDKILDWENAGKINLLHVGYPIQTPTLLFQKIEDETVKQQVDKLHNAAIKTEIVNKTENQKEIIGFDDFQKIALKVGTIKSAEKIQKSDKLLKLSVDLGNEIRTIISGIASNYNPEDILNKQVVVVSNLAPKKMKGIESYGMILMSEAQDGKLVFVCPESIIANGSEVK
ncbi:MAG: methionine--tRNA ligase [Chitinophagaceae bacterium]